MAAGQGYDSGLDNKIKALDLVCQGHAMAEIARTLGVNRSTVTRWKTNRRVIAEWERARGKQWTGGRATPADVAAPVAEVVQQLEKVRRPPPYSDDPRTIILTAGAPPEFRRDPELLARLAERLAMGMPPKWACRRVGLTYATWRRWVRLGEQGRAGYVDFLEILHLVQAIGIEALLELVRDGGPGWQGAAWTLERQWPEDFGRRAVTDENNTAGAEDESDGALRAAIAAADAAALEVEALARD